MTPEEALQAARDVKTATVLADPNDCDLIPSLVVVRAGLPVARVMISGPREAMLSAAHIAAPAFGADVLIMVNDSYMSTQKFVRERGIDAQRGDLQRLWEKGRTDLVREVIIATWVNREAEAWSIVSGYEVDREGRSISWDEPSDPFEGQGPLIEGLVEIMTRSGENDIVALIETHGIPDAMGLSPERARAHADIAAARYLAQRRHGVLLMVQGEEAKAVVERSLTSDPTVRWEAL